MTLSEALLFLTDPAQTPTTAALFLEGAWPRNLKPRGMTWTPAHHQWCQFKNSFRRTLSNNAANPVVIKKTVSITKSTWWITIWDSVLIRGTKARSKYSLAKAVLAARVTWSRNHRSLMARTPVALTPLSSTICPYSACLVISKASYSREQMETSLRSASDSSLATSRLNLLVEDIKLRSNLVYRNARSGLTLLQQELLTIWAPLSPELLTTKLLLRQLTRTPYWPSFLTICVFPATAEAALRNASVSPARTRTNTIQLK
jgi:hypothetical protein